MLLHDQGNLRGAESEFRQALAIYDKSLPANHQYRASALAHFARLLVDRGKPDEALAMSDQSLEIWNATSAASSPYTAQAHAIHAYALAHLGKPREAADELDAALPRAGEGARRRRSLRAARAESGSRQCALSPCRPRVPHTSGPVPASRLSLPRKSCRPDCRSLRCRRSAAR